jgi:L-malate glycosyltransferase
MLCFSADKPLRVCHVAMGDLWAGAEVHLKELLSKLVLMPRLSLSVILFNGGRLEEEIKAVGVPVKVLPENSWGSARIFAELVHHFKKSNIKLVHTHKYKDNILAAVAARVAGVRHIIRTVHGLSEPFNGLESFRIGAYELCDRTVSRTCVDKIIAVSSDIEKMLSSKYGSQKVIQIHNGIDCESFSPTINRDEVRCELGVESKRLLIGTIGRLTSIKGHEYLLRSAQLFLKKHSNAKFLFAGAGPLKDRLQSYAIELGIGESILFLGHREDTYRIMSALDIFVLPSLHEGIPLVLLEAMAAALPIVASRVGGIPEVLTDQVHGLLVSAENPLELAEACEKFVHDPVFAQSCAQAARFRVEREFASSTMGAKVASLYEQLFDHR